MWRESETPQHCSKTLESRVFSDLSSKRQLFLLLVGRICLKKSSLFAAFYRKILFKNLFIDICQATRKTEKRRKPQ